MSVFSLPGVVHHHVHPGPLQQLLLRRTSSGHRHGLQDPPHHPVLRHTQWQTGEELMGGGRGLQTVDSAVGVTEDSVLVAKTFVSYMNSYIHTDGDFRLSSSHYPQFLEMENPHRTTRA